MIAFKAKEIVTLKKNFLKTYLFFQSCFYENKIRKNKNNRRISDDINLYYISKLKFNYYNIIIDVIISITLDKTNENLVLI